MEKIELILEDNQKTELMANTFATDKKIIDLIDFDNTKDMFFKIDHNGMNTFLNLTSLNNHILMSFDETGKVVLRTVCKSSDDTGEFIISTQEKRILIISENNFEKLEGVVGLFIG